MEVWEIWLLILILILWYSIVAGYSQVILHLLGWYDGQVNSILRKQSVTCNSLLASFIPRMVYAWDGKEVITWGGSVVGLIVVK